MPISVVHEFIKIKKSFVKSSEVINDETIKMDIEACHIKYFFLPFPITNQKYSHLKSVTSDVNSKPNPLYNMTGMTS